MATADGGAMQDAPRGDQISASRGLAGWLESQQVSLAFTSYRTGRLYFVGLCEDGRIGFDQRQFERAMGLHVSGDNLFLATQWQVWRLVDIRSNADAPPDGFDAQYVVRTARTTGDIDLHDIAIEQDGRAVFVNTRYSCLATFCDQKGFTPVWQPPFVSACTPDDRCHLNGLALRDGQVRYVTSAARSDSPSGWRDQRRNGGCIVDVAASDVIVDGLSMPHSPRWRDGRLYVLDSGRGTLCCVDEAAGTAEAVAWLPGFLRGMALIGRYAIVASSLARNGDFSGLDLDDMLKRRGAEPWCGLFIVDLQAGAAVEWLRFETDVRELFDVAVLPGRRRPMAIGPNSPELRQGAI
ncbi:MAG: TIGR03032 family protein [Pseudomonadota bacterium]